MAGHWRGTIALQLVQHTACAEMRGLGSSAKLLVRGDALDLLKALQVGRVRVHRPVLGGQGAKIQPKETRGTAVFA